MARPVVNAVLVNCRAIIEAKGNCRKRNPDGSDGLPLYKYEDETDPSRLTAIVVADYEIETYEMNSDED